MTIVEPRSPRLERRRVGARVRRHRSRGRARAAPRCSAASRSRSSCSTRDGTGRARGVELRPVQPRERHLARDRRHSTGCPDRGIADVQAGLRPAHRRVPRRAGQGADRAPRLASAVDDGQVWCAGCTPANRGLGRSPIGERVMTTMLGVSLAGRCRRHGRRRSRDGAPPRALRSRTERASPSSPPSSRPRVRELVDAHGDVRGFPVARRPRDIAGRWLVHTATGDPRVDADIAAACERRRILCVNASDGAHGSARLAAETRSGDVVVGVVSDAGVDPRRAAQAARCHRRAAARWRPPAATAPRHRDRTRRSRRRRPGPADLMTVRGRRLLAEADVVVADRLGPTDVLSELDPEVAGDRRRQATRPPPGAAGGDQRAARRARARRAGGSCGSKAAIRSSTAAAARRSRRACAAGVPVEVVPGLTSVGRRCPQAAGIPVTHRGSAASVHVVNGQAETSSSTLAALADDTVTTVVLMGVAALPRLVAAALAAGVPPTAPSRSSRAVTRPSSARPARRSRASWTTRPRPACAIPR